MTPITDDHFYAMDISCEYGSSTEDITRDLLEPDIASGVLRDDGITLHVTRGSLADIRHYLYSWSRGLDDETTALGLDEAALAAEVSLRRVYTRI